MCKCIEKLNKALEAGERKARLEMTIRMDGMSFPYMSAVYKKGKQVKEHHLTIIPDFCPFCGKRYEK